jgi:hypothetical protein
MTLLLASTSANWSAVRRLRSASMARSSGDASRGVGRPRRGAPRVQPDLPPRCEDHHEHREAGPGLDVVGIEGALVEGLAHHGCGDAEAEAEEEREGQDHPALRPARPLRHLRRIEHGDVPDDARARDLELLRLVEHEDV